MILLDPEKVTLEVRSSMLVLCFEFIVISTENDSDDGGCGQVDHGTDSQNLPLLATSTQSSGHSRPVSLKRPLKRTVAPQPKSTKMRKDAGKLMCGIVNGGGTYGNQN